MDERVPVKEEGLCTGVVDAMIYSKIEGINRGLFLVQGMQIDLDPIQVEAEMLRLLLLMQVFNN